MCFLYSGKLILLSGETCCSSQFSTLFGEFEILEKNRATMKEILIFDGMMRMLFHDFYGYQCLRHGPSSFG